MCFHYFWYLPFFNYTSFTIDYQILRVVRNFKFDDCWFVFSLFLIPRAVCTGRFNKSILFRTTISFSTTKPDTKITGAPCIYGCYIFYELWQYNLARMRTIVVATKMKKKLSILYKLINTGLQELNDYVQYMRSFHRKNVNYMIRTYDLGQHKCCCCLNSVSWHSNRKA